jgi:hypothetical protein
MQQQENRTFAMSKLDFVELDRLLGSFFHTQDMPEAGYVVVFCNDELKLGITSNIENTDLVQGMLRGAARKVEEVAPMLIDTLPTRGNA